MSLISNCSDCTVYTYLQCKFRGNLKALIIEGEHTIAELQEAFSQICIEYLDAAGLEVDFVSDRQDIVRLQKRYMIMQNSIKQQELAISALGEPFHEGLDNFTQFAYKLEWKGDIELFRKDLERIKKQEKTFEVQLHDAVNAYNQKEAKKDAANRGKIKEIKSEAEFVQMLNELSKFQGYHLKTKETSMLELAGLIKTLNEANEQASNN